MKGESECARAWAAAAPLQLLSTLLRVTPQPRAGRLWCSPAVPGRYLPLHLAGLRLGAARLAIDIHDDGWQLTGLDGTGTALVRRPRNTPGRRRGGPASPLGTFFRTVPD